MSSTCDYCRAISKQGATKCETCGAPLGDGPPPDYRVCPYCNRRLLALGSPACNYCGRALPESFVKAREAVLRRIGAAQSPQDRETLESESDDAFKQALRSLFSLDDSDRRK